jgi:hypothetical protein
MQNAEFKMEDGKIAVGKKSLNRRKRRERRKKRKENGRWKMEEKERRDGAEFLAKERGCQCNRGEANRSANGSGHCG